MMPWLPRSETQRTAQIMLRGLHKASASWLGKTIMGAVVGLMVVAFGIWGIADIFRGFGLSTVAKVGGTEITIDQFRNFYNNRLHQLQRQINRPISSDQARALGLDRQLLAQLMADAVLDDRVRRMRLGISDADVARRVREDPAFQGVAGQFDRQLFEITIRSLGYTEQRYVAEQRLTALRGQLIETVNGGVEVPKTLLETLNRFQNEERTIDYIHLDRSKAGNIPQPTAEELTKYFDDHKLAFRAPEYRKIIVLQLTPDEMARTIEVSDSDIQKAYDAARDRYTTPERRQIQQIVFPNAEDARKAADRIAAGTSFEAIAAERGLKPQDLDLGLVAKSGVVDPAIADAAFAAKLGQVSAPVNGKFGVALLKVTKIEPEKVRSLNDVKAEIRQDLARARARESISNIQDKVEDERAAGSRLDEIAQKLKLPMRVIDAVDRSGRGPDGKQITDLPSATEVLAGAFAADVNAETDPISSNGGITWYEVAGIQPSHDRTLEEVKDRVIASWRDDEITKRLTTKADEIADKLKAGTAIKDVASANGLKVETAKGLKRRGSEGLPAGLIETVFRTAKDGVGNVQGADATDRFVFRVTAISTPAFDQAAADIKNMSGVLRNALSEELLSQYVIRLERDLGTSINETALNQAVGVSESN
jgi:peptidyl-prolyl cis-trans isomerase D